MTIGGRVKKITSIVHWLSESKALTTINYFAAGLSAAIIFGLMVYNTYATCARHFFNAPPPGSTELSTFLIPVTVFLALAYNLEAGKHIVVDVVIARLRKRNQLILNIITTILIALFGVILVWKGTKLCFGKFYEVSNTEVRLPLFPFYIFVPIGGLLLFLQSIRNIATYVLALTKKDPDSNSID